MGLWPVGRIEIRPTILSSAEVGDDQIVGRERQEFDEVLCLDQFAEEGS
jgi:hypothetical protein